MIQIKHLILFLFFGCTTIGFGQNAITLQEVLTMATSSAYNVKESEANVSTAKEQYRFFKATMKPQLGLNLQAPQYLNTSSAIVQPNGSISFTDVSQNNASFDIGISQNIGLTGGTVFASSNLRRFDDFSNSVTSYNGAPFIIGISQPIFGFNAFKYTNKLVKLRVQEVDKALRVEIENTQSIATQLYFDILLANENRKIASTNKMVNENLLLITEERFALGKVSKDEKLQLEMELNNALRNQSTAEFDFQNALIQLTSLIGEKTWEKNTNFEVPVMMENLSIDADVAVQKSLNNRPELIAFEQRIIEQERALKRAKVQYGLQAEVSVSYGFVRGANTIDAIYTNPVNSSQINLAVSVPIVDWGRKKAATNLIKIDQNLLEKTIEQQMLEFENEVKSRVLEFTQLQQEMKLLDKMKATAEERFKISNERYILGAISITDLTLAQREKDQFQRSYISTLARYWTNYYEIRKLTGYDFLTNKEIGYTN